ncbi:hypothetical protein [Bosea sp. PAMC 26642]|uniref:hypothetical protein n=1 Tax=Bosea sp. (strain PAMC 26642) TaxID=1792307 RepID=UPI0012E96358|nr:hypothetical protein [Bosea sp. PAMC 26642]
MLSRAGRMETVVWTILSPTPILTSPISASTDMLAESSDLPDFFNTIGQTGLRYPQNWPSSYLPISYGGSILALNGITIICIAANALF